MHRFYISPENWNPDALSLRDAEAHHARDVLRMKRGDRAVLFNGRGREITAEIFDLRLIGSLQPDAIHFKKILGDYTDQHRDRPKSVLMLVGPEGDFTPAELALAKTHGCLPITLGPIILRVETAAIYCLSVLSYELL